MSQSTPHIAAFAPFIEIVTDVGLYQQKAYKMDIYHQPHNITVFGNTVETFPAGIGEAFDNLINTLPGGKERLYYGLSWCTGSDITYVAAAEEKATGEAEQYGYEKFTIEKGSYLSVTVKDWQSKTACIKNVFHEIMMDERADDKTPAIEIYKDDKEMICMVAVKRSIELLEEFDATINDLYAAIDTFSDADINKKSSAESWSAAQVIVHITKSNNGIASAMQLDGEKLSRDADQRVEELKQTFLDYNVKFKSPEFILPGNGPFEKDLLLKKLTASINQLKQEGRNTNLVLAIKHPAFGEITKLELLYFVLFHIQRHTQQLKTISKTIYSPAFLSN